MTDDEPTPAQARALRIEQARADLAARYRADPESVVRFQARMAQLAAVRKRERERIAILVLGGDRPAPSTRRVQTRGRKRVVKTPVELDPGVERALALRERSVTNATPETEAAYRRAHEGSLADLRGRGTIDTTQLASAEQIRMAAEEAVADVAVRGVSYEPRIDASATGPADRLVEGLAAARRSVAYSRWRERLPAPRSAILDMLVGQPVGYTLVAKRYRMDHRKAKRLLIWALDLWPECMDEAATLVTRATLNEAHAQLDG